jgi:excisionase family DNA binding protein
MDLTHLRDRATISVTDAAALLGISRNTAYEAARAGQLPILRLGHRLLVPVPALLRMLDSKDDPGDGAEPNSQD